MAPTSRQPQLLFGLLKLMGNLSEWTLMTCSKDWWDSMFLTCSPFSAQAQWPHFSPWQPPSKARHPSISVQTSSEASFFGRLPCFSNWFHHLLEDRNSWWLRSFQRPGAVNNLLVLCFKKFNNYLIQHSSFVMALNRQKSGTFAEGNN